MVVAQVGAQQAMTAVVALATAAVQAMVVAMAALHQAEEEEEALEAIRSKIATKVAAAATAGPAQADMAGAAPATDSSMMTDAVAILAEAITRSLTGEVVARTVVSAEAVDPQVAINSKRAPRLPLTAEATLNLLPLITLSRDTNP